MSIALPSVLKKVPVVYFKTRERASEALKFVDSEIEKRDWCRLSEFYKHCGYRYRHAFDRKLARYGYMYVGKTHIVKDKNRELYFIDFPYAVELPIPSEK